MAAPHLFFTALLLHGASGEPAAPPPKKQEHPNVLLLLSDDLRSQLGNVPGMDDVSGLLSKKTPNLASLAKSGTVFTHAYAQQALCGPSRNSFLSGRKPTTTLAWNFMDSFRDAPQGADWTSLPQFFKERGYTAVGAGKIFHKDLPPDWDNPYSWDERMIDGSWAPWMYPTEDRCPNGAAWCAVPPLVPNATDDDNADDATMVPAVFEDEQTVAVVIEQLRNASEVQAATGAPWFVAAGFRKPHLMWRFPERFLEGLPAAGRDDGEEGALAQVPLPAYPTLPEGAPDLSFHMAVDDFLLAFSDPQLCGSHDLDARSGWKFPDACQRLWRRAYWAAVSYMDSCVGDVLAEVDRLGAADDTVVVFFGDHGWHLGEFGVWEKFTNFEAATRTPLIVKVPPAYLPTPPTATTTATVDNASGTAAVAKASKAKAKAETAETAVRPVVHELVELVDVFPTLVELAGFPPLDSDPVPLDGASLVPLLRNQAPHPSQHHTAEEAAGGGGGGGAAAVASTPNDHHDHESGRGEKDEEEEERVALSQFPRCVNGVQFYDPLREGYERVWRFYGQGQKPSLDPRKPPPALPFWDLTDCNDVNRTAFSHMGLSLRTQKPSGSIATTAATASRTSSTSSSGGGAQTVQPAANRSSAWRLTIWYEWDGEMLAPDWESKDRPGSTAAVELYDHSNDDADPAFFDSPAEATNLADDEAYREVRGRLTRKLERLFGRYSGNKEH